MGSWAVKEWWGEEQEVDGGERIWERRDWEVLCGLKGSVATANRFDLRFDWGGARPVRFFSLFRVGH